MDRHHDDSARAGSRPTMKGAVMGQAREIMDRLTAAVRNGDVEELSRLYAEDAVAETPDAGRLEGRAAIVEWTMQTSRAFPDASYEIQKLEIGDTAIDVGYLIGTHTGPLATPDGDIPPTGRTVRIRECDILTVAGGVATSHRFFYDQLDSMIQLGLVDPAAVGLPGRPVPTG
jgi:ketosteroid isomerase-like protein